MFNLAFSISSVSLNGCIVDVRIQYESNKTAQHNLLQKKSIGITATSNRWCFFKNQWTPLDFLAFSNAH